MREFLGYPRADGRVGIRNEVVVVATVGCSAHVVERISKETGAVPIVHQQGCLQLGDDLYLTERTLLGSVTHPNVGAVLIVGLGCETLQGQRLQRFVKDRPVAHITIQGEGGTKRALDKGVAIVEEMKRTVGDTQRKAVPFSSLVVGTKCGGSDAFSGLSANPATGYACDQIVDEGGSVLLSETPGLLGSEVHLSKRFVHPEDRERLQEILSRTWVEALRTGEALSDGELSPGNIAGGLTTLTEKSLGATVKAGSRPLQGILGFAEPLPHPGAWIMDTPGFDVITITGQTAGGAQLILFTTGRGSPVGSALAPVVKICSNTRTFEWMEEDMDVNAGSIIDGTKTGPEVGDEIFAKVLSVAEGQPTKSELWGHREYALPRLGSSL